MGGRPPAERRDLLIKDLSLLPNGVRCHVSSKVCTIFASKLLCFNKMCCASCTVVGVVRGLDHKNNLGFELCSPFVTSTAHFIQIRPKWSKFWGGLGGWGGMIKKISLLLSFALHL